MWYEQLDTEVLGLEGLGNPRFLELLQVMHLTHLGKAAGYSGVEKIETWQNFREAQAWNVTALQAVLIRLGEKYRRVQRVWTNPATERVGEPLPITLMDLANYALIAICLYEEQKATRQDLPQKINDVLGQWDPRRPGRTG